MTANEILENYPGATEVVLGPRLFGLRVTDSNIGNEPADVTFLFKADHLSQVSYRLKIEGSPKSVIDRWDALLSEFKNWNRPASVQRSKRSIGRFVKEGNTIRLLDDAIGEVAESWETTMRTAVDLELVRTLTPDSYEIVGGVKLALWEQMAREEMSSISAVTEAEAKVLARWKGRPIKEYILEFGPPGRTIQIEKTDTLYVWGSEGSSCNTTLFVSKNNKIVDRKVTGCSRN